MRLTSAMDGTVTEEDTTRTIVLELDYTHFVKPKGWMNITQIVSCPIVHISNRFIYSFTIFAKLPSNLFYSRFVVSYHYAVVDLQQPLHRHISS